MRSKRELLPFVERVMADKKPRTARQVMGYITNRRIGLTPDNIASVMTRSGKFNIERRADTPSIYTLKDSPSNMIYRVLEFPDVDSVEEHEGHCMVCGTMINEGVPEKKAFSGNFTDWDSLKRLDETHICKACRYCFQQGWMRNYPFIATSSKFFLYISKNSPKAVEGLPVEYRQRSNLLDDLFNLNGIIEDEDFIIGIPSSRKHMVFKSRLNQSKNVFTVQFGENTLHFNVEELLTFKDIMLKQYEGGFSKEEIRTGEYEQHKIRKYGLEKWKKENHILKFKRKSMVFSLIVDLLYK